jgi:hypothetical protein
MKLFLDKLWDYVMHPIGDVTQLSSLLCFFSCYSSLLLLFYKTLADPQI